MADEVLITYKVVDRMAGHQTNSQVPVLEAAKDIFGRCKKQAMQCAVKGDFIQFDSVEELKAQLILAAQNGFSIRVYDENIGG